MIPDDPSYLPSRVVDEKYVYRNKQPRDSCPPSGMLTPCCK